MLQSGQNNIEQRLIWWIVVCYFSHILQSFQYTALGELDQARAALDYEWLLYVPSMYCFALYDAYTNIVETNRLYDKEQADYLSKVSIFRF